MKRKPSPELVRLMDQMIELVRMVESIQHKLGIGGRGARGLKEKMPTPLVKT